MRAKEFVTGGDQEVAIQGLHVDRAVRGILDGVDIDQRPGGVRHSMIS
jgi:hypothetical protein